MDGHSPRNSTRSKDVTRRRRICKHKRCNRSGAFGRWRFRVAVPVRVDPADISWRAVTITPHQSLAFIGSASARVAHVGVIADAERLSIARLEGSRWRKKAGAGLLWS